MWTAFTTEIMITQTCTFARLSSALGQVGSSAVERDVRFDDPSAVYFS